jgi:hypothetical protein
MQRATHDVSYNSFLERLVRKLTLLALLILLSWVVGIVR